MGLHCYDRGLRDCLWSELVALAQGEGGGVSVDTVRIRLVHRIEDGRLESNTLSVTQQELEEFVTWLTGQSFEEASRFKQGPWTFRGYELVVR